MNVGRIIIHSNKMCIVRLNGQLLTKIAVYLSNLLPADTNASLFPIPFETKITTAIIKRDAVLPTGLIPGDNQ